MRRYLYAGMELAFWVVALLWTALFVGGAISDPEQQQEVVSSTEFLGRAMAYVLAAGTWWAGFAPAVLCACVCAIASNTCARDR